MKIGRSFLLMADNLTEALMFLSHFVGDVHQVSSSFVVLISFESMKLIMQSDSDCGKNQLNSLKKKNEHRFC